MPELHRQRSAHLADGREDSEHVPLWGKQRTPGSSALVAHEHAPHIRSLLLGGAAPGHWHLRGRPVGLQCIQRPLQAPACRTAGDPPDSLRIWMPCFFHMPRSGSLQTSCSISCIWIEHAACHWAGCRPCSLAHLTSAFSASRASSTPGLPLAKAAGWASACAAAAGSGPCPSADGLGLGWAVPFARPAHRSSAQWCTSWGCIACTSQVGQRWPGKLTRTGVIEAGAASMQQEGMA